MNFKKWLAINEEGTSAGAVGGGGGGTGTDSVASFKSHAGIGLVTRGFRNKRNKKGGCSRKANIDTIVDKT
jgi:hypothetical protein